MGKYTDRLKAAGAEIDAAAASAEKVRKSGGDTTATYERELKAGVDAWRALIGIDTRSDH